MRKAFDPLMLHALERALARRGRQPALSFGASLAGTRDILLIAARELTDLLAVVPAAGALRRRFPLARVHVLASEVCAEVLAGRPEIFGVLSWEPGGGGILSRAFFEKVRQLRSIPFDLAIALDGGERRHERLLAALSGAKLRVGVHPRGVDPTLNLVVARPLARGYRPVQSPEFLSFLGIPEGELIPRWEIPDADRIYAERFLKLRRRGKGGWLLGVDPAMGRSGVRPAPAKLAWLVERLVGARSAVPIILSLDAAKEDIDDFRFHLKAPPLEASSRGIRDTLSFARCCDLFLSGNTTLFHLAVALGVPACGLFGLEEEERWVPPEDALCRVFRWRPGERVREGEFLASIDELRSRGAESPPRAQAGASEGGSERGAAPGAEEAPAPRPAVEPSEAQTPRG